MGQATILTSVASPIRMVSVFIKMVSETSYVPGGMYTTYEALLSAFFHARM